MISTKDLLILLAFSSMFLFFSEKIEFLTAWNNVKRIRAERHAEMIKQLAEQHGIAWSD